MAMPLETRISVREGSWQQYDWVREGDVMVPMRDGVRLATDIYRPALDGQALSGPFPVLMERTPYSKVRDDLTAEVLRPPRLRGGGAGRAWALRLRG